MDPGDVTRACSIGGFTCVFTTRLCADARVRDRRVRNVPVRHRASNSAPMRSRPLRFGPYTHTEGEQYVVQERFEVVPLCSTASVSALCRRRRNMAAWQWQSFYHFTVGGQVDDTRLTTLRAYDFEEEPRAQRRPVRHCEQGNYPDRLDKEQLWQSGRPESHSKPAGVSCDAGHEIRIARPSVYAIP